MLSDLVSFGMTRNDQHHTVAAIDADCPNPCWEYAAAYGGANAVDIASDPARPTQTTPLLGLLAPRAGNRFLFEDRLALLSFGIASSFISGGQLRVERAITTYQQNTFGAPDTSYLDSETLHTSAYVLRALKSVITSKYPRHKLADDGTRFAAGQAIVTPAVIKGELCAVYGQMEYLGIVENLDTFKQYLIVERDTTDPNRVNVLFPPDYVNQLRVFAVLNQFRLQYPASQLVA
jgi:phage tail sheath gpL-like